MASASSTSDDRRVPAVLGRTPESVRVSRNLLTFVVFISARTIPRRMSQRSLAEKRHLKPRPTTDQCTITLRVAAPKTNALVWYET